MMNKQSILFYKVVFGVMSLVLLSCSEPDQSEGQVKEDSLVVKKVQHMAYEVKAEDFPEGIMISDIQIDTTNMFATTKGITVSFSVSVGDKSLSEIQQQGYSSFYIDLTCQTDEGKTYANRSHEVLDKGKQRVHINKNHFISFPSKTTMEMHVPFRALELKEGAHQLMVNIGAYPAKFQNEKDSSEFRVLDKIASISKASVSLKLPVLAPKLYSVQVKVKGFKLNTQVVNPSRYDFALGGTGYPDLYWSLKCGGDMIYFTKQVKNTIEYKPEYTSPKFFVTKEDKLKITLADYDNGPFNVDDIIDTWTGTYRDLPIGKTETLSFGNLEYLKLEGIVE